MARPFSSGEVKKLIDDHQKLYRALLYGKQCTKRYEDRIARASDMLLGTEMVKILKEIPVDEINREKNGFRIKNLKESGFDTVASIFAASVYEIASVQGISNDGAAAIKKAAMTIAENAKKAVKIRLSADERTPEAAALVSAISRYRKSTDPSGICSDLLNEYGSQIEQALEDAIPGKSGLRWLFASREKKQKASEACELLSSLIQGSYGHDAAKAAGQIETIENGTDDEAWKDYINDPVGTINVLERVCPEIPGNGDSVYGLPEELAREIQEECFFPEGLQCTLRRYQEWGVKYILHQERVLLGDEMGLGKTVQAIAAMVSLKNTGATHFIVVCPASVITNWCREIQKMSKLHVTKIHGALKEEALDSWIKTGGVAVTNYETTGIFRLEEDFRFSMLIVDEAHYIKNPEAKRTENVIKISRHTDRLLFMTGTALENRVDEMVSLMSLLNVKVASRVKGMEALASAPAFREKIAPVYYRRRREDVLTELPELIETREWCTMTAEDERAYEAAALRSGAGNYSEMRRVSWNVDDLKDSSKASRLLEIIEEAKSEGRKILVFSFFLETLRKLRSCLDGRCMGPVNGSVPPARRQEMIDEFDKAPAGTVLLAQIQAGGTGLNIQSASVVILCEPQFKPSVENQAISRAYRMGQTRNVLVYRLLCEDSIDERMIERLESKQKIFDAFADESAAAQETIVIDDTSMMDIIADEIERISRKNGTDPVTGNL